MYFYDIAFDFWAELNETRYRERFQIGGKTRLAFTLEMTNDLAFIQLKAAEVTGNHVTVMVS